MTRKKFIPEKRELSPFGHIAFKVTPETHARYKALAKAHGVSMIEFIRQAVDFAIENMGTPIVRMEKKGDARVMSNAAKRTEASK